MTETAVVVQKAYEWNLWILPKVEKFPKSYRFSVGQNLVDTSLDLLMLLGLKGDRRVFQPAKRRQPHQNISEDVKAAFDQINVP